MKEKLSAIPTLIRIGTLGSILIFILTAFSVLTTAAAHADTLNSSARGRIVQVDLAQHAKISQYVHIDSSAQGYGNNACGLVAAAAAVGGNEWVDVVDLIATAAGSDYHMDSGIQPSKYVTALEQVLGMTNVTELNMTNLDRLYTELEAGNIVIVDLKVRATSLAPSAKAPTYAHFARVLGMDKNLEQVYIENTLRGDAYWTVSFDDFLAAWEYPETTSSLIPDPTNAENVTNWAVVLDQSLLSDDFMNEL